MVYFFQATGGGPIKIGCSGDVEQRRAQLEAHYGLPLALLATLEGGRDEERAIHERFAELRLGRTEQFRPALALLAFIGRPLLVDPNPDAIEAMSGPESTVKPVRLDLTPDVHRLLRLVAANAEKSMASYARDALERHVRDEARRLGIKD